MLILGAPTPFDEERRLITALFAAGLAAVDPEQAVKRALVVEDGRLSVNSDDIEVGGGVHLIAIGKAAVAMTRGAFAVLGETIRSGDVLTKEGHVSRELPANIRVFEAAHPIPDARGVAATRAILDRLAGLAAGTVVLALISGGGSALLEAPRDDLTLGDLAETTRLLLQAGAPIDALNSARAPLSRVKAGGLRRSAPDATWLTLVLSDVLSNDPRVIASGPTILAQSDRREALAVLDRFGVREQVPSPVIAVLNSPAEASSNISGRSYLEIVGDNASAVAAAEDEARRLGLRPRVIWTRVEGEARDLGRSWIVECKTVDPDVDVLMGGGELTVTVRGEGRGGRNTEFALAAAVALEDRPGEDWVVASLATDGQDALTGMAGAIADPDTCRRARKGGVDPRQALEENDSLAVFEVAGGAVETGPTGTNVNDLYFAVRRRGMETLQKGGR
ncbi:MAG: DUF4147 domain-containing protein [Thermomicrobiales bacterium]